MILITDGCNICMSKSFGKAPSSVTRVTRVLDMIASGRGYPTQVRVDNGPEFISHHMAGWAWRHAVRIQFFQSGKTAQNGFVEHFNRTYREDVFIYSIR